jgi:hypothetical protein
VLNTPALLKEQDKGRQFLAGLLASIDGKYTWVSTFDAVMPLTPGNGTTSTG